MNDSNSTNKSPNILNTSSNLLGLCFIVLTSISLLDVHEKTFIDEVVSVAALTFMISSILSFLSLRAGNAKRNNQLEKTADYFFIVGLSTLFLVIVIITFNFM